MIRTLVTFALSFCPTWAVAAPGVQTCFGAGDVNGDAFVDVGDLATLAQCMTGSGNMTVPPGCDPGAFERGDVDLDDDLDVHDVAELVLHVGTAYFDFGPRRDNQEAELLAMDLADALRAPEIEYNRILGDLAAIRGKYPELVDVVDDTDFAPNQLLVGIGNPPPGGDYETLNAFYQVLDEEIHASWRLLTFCDNLNAVVLAPIYTAAPEVNWADPNWLIGIDDYITIAVIGTTYRYNIDDGFWDCFDGCDCHREWIIDVDDLGNVMFVSYQEWGQPWCIF
jgi:hypothetical protein